jgi:HAD superfamily hydrolase (TIGR01490 family)
MSVLGSKPSRNGRGKAASGAAFYDLDGTLADLNLVHAALFILTNLGEWHRRIGSIAGLAASAPRLFLAERKDRRLLNQVLFECLKGVSVDRLVELGQEYCDRVLIKHLYHSAIELVEANRKIGLEPVLVTGSPDFIVAPLCRELEIRYFAANRLIISHARATGRLAPPIMAADEKAHWCASFATQHNFDLRKCWGYADSHYDLPFLVALGHPVAVNPDRKLRAAAMSRQWPILRFDKSTDDESDEASGAAILELPGRSADGAS